MNYAPTFRAHTQAFPHTGLKTGTGIEDGDRGSARPFDRRRTNGVLRLSPSFEVLHALVELFVGEMDESPGFAELLLDGLVPDAFSFDMDRQAFGYKAHFTMKSFDKHAAVALDLFDPFIDCIELAVYLVESPVNPVEPLIQPTNKPMKTFIQVLNKLLIHTASAAT